MSRPVPVVNRQLSDVVRREQRKQTNRVKKQKLRLRQIVGGGGLKLYFEEPDRPLTKLEKRVGVRHHKDPLVEESRKVTQRRLRKERARDLVEILFLHLARYELAEKRKLMRVPNLQYGNGWLRDFDEEQLMDALLAELCGACRLHTVMRIHTALCKMRMKRERGNLFDQFFKEVAQGSHVLRHYPAI